jgi:hypothetical protein
VVTTGVFARVAVLAVVLLCGTARADLPPPGPLPELVETPAPAPLAPCVAEATELRDHLDRQADKANTWNWAWRGIFTGSAVATGVLGYLDPVPEWNLKYGLYGSAGKATIGALARWVLPLRIHTPATSGDACTDVAALRKEIKRVAKKQKGLFWMGHIGGILVNLGGAAYVYYYDGLGKAALSIAIGYPVGALSNYTMPRGSWKLYRERESAWSQAAASATITVLPNADRNGWTLGLSGTF